VKEREKVIDERKNNIKNTFRLMWREEERRDIQKRGRGAESGRDR
jgi:hypothetical protein